MILKYGSYQHDLNDPVVQIDKSADRGPSGVVSAVRHTWTVRGMLHADSQSQLTTRLRNLENAYSRDGLDARLLLDNGTPTAHSLISADSVQGTRVVVPPSYPEDGRRTAEYTRYRSYVIVLEASFEVVGQPELLDFRESVSYQGGGPRFVIRQPLRGQPVKQHVADLTPTRCRQSGTAIGRTRPPLSFIPGPLYPNDEHRDLRVFEIHGPVNIWTGNGFANREHTVDYTYEFEGINLGGALPHIRV